MKKLAIIGALALAGCASLSSEEYVAGLGTYDICRLTMGGPHAVAAEHEARRRGIDCAPLYPTIQATEARRTGAVLQYLQMQQQPVYQPVAPQFPQRTNCTSYRVGNSIETTCR